MSDTWMAVITHHEARLTYQRSEAARRRGAAVLAGLQALGSAKAVGDATGRSGVAISKAWKNAENVPLREPLADYWEVELPASGQAVPLPAEWRQLPPEEQPQAARRAAAYWAAQAHVAHVLFNQVMSAAITMNNLMGLYEKDPEQAASCCDLSESWPVPQSLEEARALTDVLDDLADGFMRQRNTARAQNELWTQRSADPENGSDAR